MTKPVEITPERVDAFVASGFNVTAARTPTMRADYPNGMTPADARGLSKEQRLHWLIKYRDHVITDRHALYTRDEVQSALDMEIARNS